MILLVVVLFERLPLRTHEVYDTHTHTHCINTNTEYNINIIRQSHTNRPYTIVSSIRQESVILSNDEELCRVTLFF